MGGIVLLVALFVLFAAVLAVIAFVAYRRVLRRAKGVERGLKMVPLLIHLPPPSEDVENTGTRTEADIMRSRVNEAQVLYDLIAGTAQSGFKSAFYGQRHIAFEIIANNGLVHYFAAVPIALVSVVEQAIVTAYPGARLEEVEDHNIFNPQGRLTGTVGGELVLRHDAVYPIAVIDQMERDPMSGLINALYKLQVGEGAAIQIMLRPANPNWIKRAAKVVAGKRHTRQGGLGFTVGDIAKGAVKTPEQWREQAAKFEPSKLEESMLQAVEEKTKHPGYEVLVRVLASSPNYDRSQAVLRSIVTAFALFESPGSNGFQFIEGRDMQGLVTAFIFRFFPPELTSTILNSVELATLFHLPDAQFTPTTQVERQQSKQVDGPANMPATGLLMGYNFYRGVKKEIRLSSEDRRRHTYIVGQTGTGKSTILENLAVQDMLAGNGFAFIDPHGDTAEALMSMVPKNRAEDVIYFNPGDMQNPLGLNLFEFSSPEQKDFLIQESINMLYKLYDPNHTGIIGPRFEHWYRNAALTLMADPHGASFIEIPKVFTDAEYLKSKFKYLNDPTVIDFWTKEMGQTSDYHKSEMLGWFSSKFGAFQSNEMMRNIIGQTQSAFNLRDIMDNKKILIVNLGKGQVGELNAQLLGMIFVMKFQAAAMSRTDIPEDQRADFCLYVDEFQNFSTDSFASILSEARKYRLNLIVANQFIGQLTDPIRDAVFGNVGTMISYRCGPEDAEFLVKQFEPVFDQRDLVNLPNYNAIMKLLIGGLPSLPFSVTMLPRLGQPHQEMGLAVKQLSAAKYGRPRSQVEAEIFARLQNKPLPESAPQPAPVTPPAPQAAATIAPTEPPQPAPEVPAQAPAPPVAPAPQQTAPPNPIKTTQEDIDAMLPPAPNSSAQQAPVASAPPPSEVQEEAPVEKPVEPQAPTSEPKPEPAAEEPNPEPEASEPPKPPVPAAEDKGSLSLTSLKVGVPAPSEKSKPDEDVKLIEAHEADGKTEASKPNPEKPKAEPLLIEAHETDGKVGDEPKPKLEQKEASKTPKPDTKPEPKPEPKPEAKSAPQVGKTMIATHRSAPKAAEPTVSKHNDAYAQAAKPKAPSQKSKPSQEQAPAPQPVIVPPAPEVKPEAAPEPQKQPVTEPHAPKPGEAVAPATPVAPAPAAQTPSEPSVVAAPQAPDLKPGEVYVDDSGNVVQG